MSSNNNNNNSSVHRRKATKNKTNPKAPKSQHPENGRLEEEKTSGKRNGYAVTPSIQKRSITPEKPTTSSSTSATRVKTSSSSSSASYCNGGTSVAATFLDCCRDINCRLNKCSCPVPTLAVNYNNFLQESRERRSVSVTSHDSTTSYNTRSSSSPLSFEKEGTPLLSAPKDRDTSPDSGIDTVEAERFLAYFDQKHLKAFTVKSFTIDLNLDLVSWLLFFFSCLTRFYKLSSPKYVVFDETHFGKFVSHYLTNSFFFDAHPPLGKQLITAAVGFTSYDGNFTFPHIGAKYPANMPIFWMRFVPALCGSFLAPTIYKLLLTAGMKRWTAALAGVLVILDNALLTQSRFVLMESMVIFFTSLGLYFLLHFHRCKFPSMAWFFYGLGAAISFTCATSVKYIGFFSFLLAGYLTVRHYWCLLFDPRNSNIKLWMQTIARGFIFFVIPISLYLGIFYLHLNTLYKAGPHDNVMTSAFQASLEGGLASITRGQPLKVAHGSQITLRNTHGRACWLHSHAQVYPVRYPDKRGSSHQQQVTCYSFKDVNNWWIVKRPERDDLVVDDEPDAIKHGDIIQLVHGITSRALNSHDVAAPMTPNCQEVSCYIDYEIKMAGELLWQVDITNRDTEGDVWHAIKSEVRLIHTTTKAALRFTGRQLPEWAFNQHEIVADRQIKHRYAIWNVEEHRYTKTRDQKERERQLLKAEMIPTKKTKFTFFEKFLELQAKMIWNSPQIQSHMYSSEPFEWPLMDKGIAYWAHNTNGAQIHLLGNLLVWNTATYALLAFVAIGIFYLLRRRRLCYDIPEEEWLMFVYIFDIFFVGYLIHYLPYYFMDRTLFLYNYLPAFIFKLSLLCYVIEHVDYLIKLHLSPRFKWIVKLYYFCIIAWLTAVFITFLLFWPLSTGLISLKKEELLNLRLKDTWDLILVH